MRIEGWSVEAFGALRDFTLKTLGPNLNILLGPNEAGKSTLLEFMRGVLFGFPLKRGKPVAYAAPTGLRHGGRLFLSTEFGPVVVERFAGKDSPVRVVFADGRSGSESELKLLLRQADDSLFRNVFAISLSELQDFGTLSAAGVRDKIFSAGVAGAGRSARAVIDRLNTGADVLFKPRANGGAINSLLIRLEDLRLRLAAARNECGRYQALLEEEERIEATMKALADEADRLRHRKAWYQDLVDLWPVWSKRCAAERRRNSLPPVDAFPPQAAVRLAEARNRMASARERCETLNSEIAGKEEQRDAILPELQPALVSLAADVSDLAQSVALHRKSLREHSQCVVSVEDAQRNLERKLLELGSDWDERRLKAFDVSIPRREEIRIFSEAIEKARAKCEDAQRAAQLASRQLEQQEREAERIRQKRDALKLSKAERIPEAEQAIRRLRSSTMNLVALQARHESISATLAQRRAALAERRGDSSARISSAVPIGFYGVAVILIGFGIWQLMNSGDMTGAAIAAAGAVALALGIVLHLVARRSALLRALRDEAIARMESEALESEWAANKSAEEIAALSKSIAHDAAVLGIESAVTPEILETKASEFEAQKAVLADWNRLDTSLTEAAQKCAEHDMELRTAQLSLDDAGRALDAAETVWSRKKESLGVSETLSPEGLFQFFTELERARDLLRHRDHRVFEQVELERQIESWEERAQRQLRVAGRESASAHTGEDLLPQFASLQRACGEQLDLERKLAALEAEVLALSRQRETARAALERIEWDLRDLFREAGVADAGEFHSKLAIFEERKNLGQEILSLDNAIRTRLGERANMQVFFDALTQGDLQGWNDNVIQIAAEMEQALADRDQAVREHEIARQRRIECELSADVPSLEAQLETARVQLEDAARRWRVETLAGALLQDTLADFQRTRQPAVITDAAKSFQLVTAGRYVRLLPQDDQETLLVETADGETRQLEELSRGTAEQLYLCLRLSFLREFSRRGGALPLVMDDVLVNFDPQRSRAVARLLAEFSLNNQVLLFTCHPETAAIFDQAAPGHIRINLSQR
jgi:uncharacterized protein YhaN